VYDLFPRYNTYYILHGAILYSIKPVWLPLLALQISLAAALNPLNILIHHLHHSIIRINNTGFYINYTIAIKNATNINRSFLTLVNTSIAWGIYWLLYSSCDHWKERDLVIDIHRIRRREIPEYSKVYVRRST